MTLKNDIELANTRAKLHRLELRYEELRNDTSEDDHVRELTMRSLKGPSTSSRRRSSATKFTIGRAPQASMTPARLQDAYSMTWS